MAVQISLFVKVDPQAVLEVPTFPSCILQLRTHCGFNKRTPSLYYVYFQWLPFTWHSPFKIVQRIKGMSSHYPYSPLKSPKKESKAASNGVYKEIIRSASNCNFVNRGKKKKRKRKSKSNDYPEEGSAWAAWPTGDKPTRAPATLFAGIYIITHRPAAISWGRE